MEHAAGEYACDLCGACCATFPIFASKADATRAPEIMSEGKKLEGPAASAERAYQLHPLPFLESCGFLDAERKCRIYETRPDVCRRFEPGGDQCQEARRRKGLGPLLPEMKST